MIVRFVSHATAAMWICPHLTGADRCGQVRLMHGAVIVYCLFRLVDCEKIRAEGSAVKIFQNWTREYVSSANFWISENCVDWWKLCGLVKIVWTGENFDAMIVENKIWWI